MLEDDGLYTLLIIEADSSDNGTYECVAINSAGEARCESTCYIETPHSPTKMTESMKTGDAPKVFSPLRDAKIEEGQSVIFKCRIGGVSGKSY